MSITLSALQQQRRDTAANWTSANPTLLAGEWGYETDTGKWKVGDGSTAWTSLAYVAIPDNNGLIPIDQLLLPLGTAAAPSLAFTGDVNTGLYSPGADQLAISTNGTGRLFVNASGNVGLGTSSPVQLLEVENSSGNTAINITSSDTGYAELYFGDQSDAAASALSYEHSSEKLRLYNGGSARVTLDSSGRVGVGTTSPSSLLSLGGSVSAQKLLIYESSNQRYGFGIQASELRMFGDDSAALTFGHVSTTDGTTFSEKARIDSSGRLLVGTTNSSDNIRLDQKLAIANASSSSSSHTGISITNYSNQATVCPVIDLKKSRSNTDGGTTVVQDDDNLGYLVFHGTDGDQFHRAAEIAAYVDGTPGNNDMPGRLVFSTTADGASSPTERMRIKNDGGIYIGKTDGTMSVAGVAFEPYSTTRITTDSSGVDEVALYLNRQSTDGALLKFFQENTEEGSISVSGTTVSYNGAHLSRWSQLPGGVERTEILRGTVLSNIDEMCEWGEEDNEQLNRMQVSNVEGDRNVAGVFQGWDDDDDTYTNDFYCAMTGDFIIRIAQGTTVARGDLLMSAGDGTAKPQDDDIIRSKTIAKVTSTNVSCTYADGSYCVPCVLMAC